MYHYKNSRASVNKDEPVYLTKYITTWVLPAPLQAKYGTPVITEQLKTIQGLNLDKLPAEMKEQFYHGTKRRYHGTVVDTNLDVDMKFEVNVDKNGVMYPYNIFKDWSKLIWDPHTAHQSLKTDYSGSVTIDIHMKNGVVLRDIYLPVLFLREPINPMELDYNTEAIYEMDIKFAAENPTDLIIGTASA